MTNISVVIPSYNAQDSLPRTLGALKSQIIQKPYEIIVIDCSEGDEVQKICEQYEVEFHHVKERFNPGIGRNIGAEIAKGELLVFVDADVELEKYALENAYLFYQQGHSVFGGALELNERVNPTTASYLEHYFFNHESQKDRPVCRRSNLSSALMVLDRTFFLEAGGFKNIPRMQDTEMTERLISQGAELYFCPNVIGLQIQDSPIKKVLRKIFINGKNLYVIRYQRQNALKKTALFLLLPLISSFKVIRIIFRHLRYQTPKQKKMTLAISPLLFIAGIYWMLGFYRSMLFGGGISKNRD